MRWAMQEIIEQMVKIHQFGIMSALAHSEPVSVLSTL